MPSSPKSTLGAWILCLLALSSAAQAQGYLWWEAESPARSNFQDRGWLKAQNESESAVLSGGAWLVHQGPQGSTPLFAEYRIHTTSDSDYEFWTRKFWKHGPFRWRFDNSPWRSCGRDIALADSETLRTHVCANWVHLGAQQLSKGKHTLRIELLGDRGTKLSACFDAFLLIPGPFEARGKIKPDAKVGGAAPGTWAFEPGLDSFEPALLDLSGLNEEEAGRSGFVTSFNGRFVRGDGHPLRFWGVGIGPEEVRMNPSALRYLARRLAKLGVNCVRIHGPIFDRSAKDPARVDEAYLAKLHFAQSCFKRVGIYTKLSFYFPLWFPIDKRQGISGYETTKNKTPFALLQFDPKMQRIYKKWAKELLTTKNPHTGLPFGQDPAVAIVEIQNEDSYFFWTFNHDNIPSERRALLERKFATWCRKRYGGSTQLREAWGRGAESPKDDWQKGRLNLYPAWNMTTRGYRSAKSKKRIQDQLRFLAEEQRAFYSKMVSYFRGECRARNLISCSNWTTADPRLLDGIERWTYSAADVMDQHGYFGGQHEGNASSYSVAPGQSFKSRSALLNPLAAPIRFNQVDGFPQIISEIGWPNPNRFKAEMPFLMAAYGSLQGIDGFFSFAVNTSSWNSQLAKFPVATPSIMGQFPAAALAFRRGDFRGGEEVFHERIKIEKQFAMKGSAAVVSPPLDQLRQIQIPKQASKVVDAGLHPLAFYVGPVTRSFDQGRPGRVMALDRNLRDHRILSNTSELSWDWKAGVLLMNSPKTQGAVGFLGAQRRLETQDLILRVKNEYAAVVATSLDDQPLARSRRILVQVATEEWPRGFSVSSGRITAVGGYPLDVASPHASLQFKGKRSGRIVALDANGRPKTGARHFAKGEVITLAPEALYNLISF